MVNVIIKRGPRAASEYIKRIYRCAKTDAGLHLPVVPLSELLSKEVEIKMHRPVDEYGSLTITEGASLCAIVADRQPKKILEIGSFQGLTTLNLAMNAPDAEIHTLDLPPSFAPSNTLYDNNDAGIINGRGFCFYKDRPEGRNIHQHLGDTATFDFDEIGHGVDLCLVDAAHSYQYVRNDTLKALPLMSEHSLMLWHDYGRNDFLAAPQDAWGVSGLLHELRDYGIAIIEGTSFGVLELTPERREDLLSYLHTDGHARPRPPL